MPQEKPVPIAGGSLAALVKVLRDAAPQGTITTSGRAQLMELLGKAFATYNGGGVVEADVPYLEQYVGNNTLTPTSLRPLPGTTIKGEVYQSPLKDNARFVGRGKATLPGSDVTNSWPTKPTRLFGNVWDSTEADPLDGLGGHSIYGNTDERGPYVSVYDTWDMDSPNVPQPAGRIADKVLGTPFTVYDQFEVISATGPNGRQLRRRTADKPTTYERLKAAGASTPVKSHR